MPRAAAALPRTIFERGSCNKLERRRRPPQQHLPKGRERERAPHKGELIKRLNFQEWPFEKPLKYLYYHGSLHPSLDFSQAMNERVFMLDITKELLLAPLSPLVSPEGPASSGGSDAKSVEADFEFFSPN